MREIIQRHISRSQVTSEEELAASTASGKTDALTPLTVSGGIRKGGLVAAIEDFLTTYLVLPRHGSLVITGWILGSYHMDIWDRFPHLLIHSPEKRCGKTTLLEAMNLLCKDPMSTQALTPAALFRIIEAYRPTLLIDEAQNLNRNPTEYDQVIKELLCSFNRGAKVHRCANKGRTIIEFSIYCPKVVAHIGKPDSILADRCLPVELRRKLPSEEVERWRLRDVEPEAAKLKNRIEDWSKKSENRVRQEYKRAKEFDISNDRLADLLIPLQAILTTLNRQDRFRHLKAYADLLIKKGKSEDAQSYPIRMLESCKQIFESENYSFISTTELLDELVSMEEEPWARWNREGLNAHSLAKLLSTFNITPKSTGKIRGYSRNRFMEAWERYCSD